MVKFDPKMLTPLYNARIQQAGGYESVLIAALTWLQPQGSPKGEGEGEDDGGGRHG